MDNEFTPKEAVRVKRFFSQEELDEKRKIQTNRSIEVDDLEDEIKSLKQQYTAKIKEIKSMCKGIRSEVKLGYEHIERMCYCVPNYTTGMMEFTDCETDAVLMERKLLPEEKQLIFTSKTA